MTDQARRPSFVSADRPWPPRRVEPAPEASTSPAAHLQVIGRIRHQAELRHGTRGGTALLSFDVDVGRGLPFVVRLVVPDDAASLIAAERQAADLVAGALVLVHARGAMPRTDHDIAALVLLDVSDVTIQEE